jgi:hypothetical protein
MEEHPCTACRWIWLLQHNSTTQTVTKIKETLRRKIEADTEARKKEEEEQQGKTAQSANPDETTTSQQQEEERDEANKENRQPPLTVSDYCLSS